MMIVVEVLWQNGEFYAGENRKSAVKFAGYLQIPQHGERLLSRMH